MSRQLSCRGMCKFVTWSGYYSSFKRNMCFIKVRLFAHKFLVRCFQGGTRKGSDCNRRSATGLHGWLHLIVAIHSAMRWPNHLQTVHILTLVLKLFVELSRYICIFYHESSRYIWIFFIFQHWDCIDSWNISPWKTRACLSNIFNTMGADVLVTQGARASAAIQYYLT